MAYQPFLIAPFGTGLDTDMEPWMNPPDAFEEIINGHIHHGYIEKRQGYFETGKLVHGHSTNLVITGISVADPGVVTVTSTADLTNGDTVIIWDVTGMTEVNGVEQTVANLTPTTFEIASTVGNTAYAGGGVVYIIPGDRVMGLRQFTDAQNIKQTLGFDTQRASIYNSTNERFEPLDNADIMDGSDTNYIWSDNWASTASTAAATIFRLYFTNGKAYDAVSGLNGIRYYDGVTSTTTLFRPQINSASFINGCKLIFAYRGRLLLLHTFEGANTYPQRARWSQLQNPDNADSWDDAIAGKGGFVDAPTGEQIISARSLQNGLIVLFTNSVWTLTPTADPALPYRWDKINDFRACDGQMSTTEFDRYVLAVGIRGVTATDGVETRRIDDRIEDFATEDINAEVYSKVFAERSYANRRTWILYPKVESTDANAALILDDESSAWSKYDIAMNVLGYAQNVSEDLAAEDFTAANNKDWAAEDAGNSDALSFFMSKNTELFMGGDTNGVVYTLESGATDDGSGISFELVSSAWAPYKDQGKEAQFGYIDFFVDTDQESRLNVEFFKDNNKTPYKSQKLDCIPNLNYISSITNAVIKAPATSGVRITSTQHGLTTGDQVFIYGVQGMTEINNIQFSVTVIDINTFDIAIDATNFVAYVSGGQIVERRFYRGKVWKRAYAGGIGYQHSIRVTEEGTNSLRIHAFKPYFRERGRRTI